VIEKAQKEAPKPPTWGELQEKALQLEGVIFDLKKALERAAMETEKQRQRAERTEKELAAGRAEASEVKGKALAHAKRIEEQFAEKNANIKSLEAFIEKTGIFDFVDNEGKPNAKIPTNIRKEGWIQALLDIREAAKENKDAAATLSYMRLHADLSKPISKTCICEVCKIRREMDEKKVEVQKLLSQLDVQKRTIERYEHRLNPTKKK